MIFSHAPFLTDEDQRPVYGSSTFAQFNYHQTLETGKLPGKAVGRALRRDDIGVIQVGAKADLVVFNGDSPNMLGWSDPIVAVVLDAKPGEFRKRDFRPVDRGPLSWAQVQARFLEAAWHIQPQVATPPPMPDQLWGTGEFGDVEAVSTVARQPGGCGPRVNVVFPVPVKCNVQEHAG